MTASSPPQGMFASPVQGADSDERFTPSWIFDGLKLMFDTDPASPGHDAGDCVPAQVKLTKADDGLAQPWIGRVWLNPPFSNATPWARRFIDHGQGVFLGPVSNGAWCIELMRASDLVWFMRDFPFIHPTHAGKRSSMPLFMAAIGATEAEALASLATSGRHDGVLFQRLAERRSLPSLIACVACGDDAELVGAPGPNEPVDEYTCIGCGRSFLSDGSITFKPVENPDGE